MDRIKFLVKGSAPDPYAVTFERHGTELSAHCTCPAGENGQYCKHRLSILGGRSAGVVSGNQSDVAMVVSWLAGSPLQAALEVMELAQLTSDEAQKALSAAKKRVALAMR